HRPPAGGHAHRAGRRAGPAEHHGAHRGPGCALGAAGAVGRRVQRAGGRARRGRRLRAERDHQRLPGGGRHRGAHGSGRRARPRPGRSPVHELPPRARGLTGVTGPGASAGARAGGRHQRPGPQGRPPPTGGERWPPAPPHRPHGQEGCRRPIEEAAPLAFSEPPEITERIRLSRALHATVCRAVAARVAAAGARVPAPRAAFYAYPDFAPWREHLARRYAVTTGAGLARHLLDRYGMGVLPGSAFGEPWAFITAGALLVLAGLLLVG